MLLLGSLFGTAHFVFGQEPPKNEVDLYNLSVRNQEILHRNLGPLLNASALAGRVYVQSSCLGNSTNILFFPRINVKPQTQRKPSVGVIRKALAHNRNVRVAQSRPGILGIWVGDVSNDLLSTRIHVLRLGDLERYNYTKAIAAIIDTKEVQTKMRQTGMDAVPNVAMYPIVSPDPKVPHLPASMTDLTVDEALDRIARTFGGLIIYWECRGEKSTRLFSLLMHEI
jgi:hypothetical protein